MIVSPDVWLSFLTKKSQEEQKDKLNFIFYGCLVLGSLIFSSIRAYAFLWTSVRCSERLHDKMVAAIVQAPVLEKEATRLCGRSLQVRFAAIVIINISVRVGFMVFL